MARPAASADRDRRRAVRPRRQRKPAAERRAEIVAATISILAVEGLHAWTTAAVAKRVGVSEATIFRHFRSKEQILSTAVRQQVQALRELVERYEGAGSAWERAEGLVLHVLGFIAEHGGGPLVILTGQAIRISPAIRREVVATRALIHGRLTALFQEALAARRPGAVEPGALANLAIAVGQSTGLRWLMEGRRLPLRETASAMLRALRGCLGSEGVPAPGRTP